MHVFDFTYFSNLFSNFDTCPEPDPEAQNLLSSTFTSAFFSENQQPVQIILLILTF